MNVRILSAIVIGLTMVGIVFLLPKAPKNVAGETVSKPAEPIRKFIPVHDTDGNGIPDWQESFAYGTVILAEAGTNDPPSKAGTLITTIATRLVGGSSTDQLLAEVGEQLAKSGLDRQYTREEIRISQDTTPETLRRYGNEVVNIMFAHPIPRNIGNEMEIVQNALLHDDPKRLANLELIAAAYEGMLKDMLQTPVPSTLVREHLSLINVYNALAINIRAFNRIYEDSLTANIRFRRYTADAQALEVAISNLYLKLHQSGVRWSSDDPVSRIIVIE